MRDDDEVPLDFDAMDVAVGRGHCPECGTSLVIDPPDADGWAELDEWCPLCGWEPER